MSQNYYVLRSAESEPEGPFSIAELRAEVEGLRMPGSALVARDGDRDWVPLASVVARPIWPAVLGIFLAFGVAAILLASKGASDGPNGAAAPMVAIEGAFGIQLGQTTNGLRLKKEGYASSLREQFEVIGPETSAAGNFDWVGISFPPSTNAVSSITAETEDVGLFHDLKDRLSAKYGQPEKAWEPMADTGWQWRRGGRTIELLATSGRTVLRYRDDKLDGLRHNETTGRWHQRRVDTLKEGL